MVKKDFNWSEINLLIGIKNCSNLKEITINEIASQLNISKSHPYLYKILSYLIDEHIMVLTRVIGSVKIFKIEYKMMRDLIDEQDIVNDFVTKYIKKDHHFDW